MDDKMTTRLGWGAALFGFGSILLLTVSAWGYRLGDWPWAEAYRVATWGLWAAVAGITVAMAGGVSWLRGRQGGGVVVLLGLLLSLPVTGLGLAFDITARITPPINDISTDTENSPVLWTSETPSDYPPENAAPQHAAYPDVRPLDLPLPFGDTFSAVLALVKERGWEVLSADPADTQIEAIAKSRFFGFEDEVVIRITETDTGTVVDMRSRSLIGRLGRGTNARRIEAFLSDLEQIAVTSR